MSSLIVSYVLGTPLIVCVDALCACTSYRTATVHRMFSLLGLQRIYCTFCLRHYRNYDPNERDSTRKLKLVVRLYIVLKHHCARTHQHSPGTSQCPHSWCFTSCCVVGDGCCLFCVVDVCSCLRHFAGSELVHAAVARETLPQATLPHCCCCCCLQLFASLRQQ